MTLSARKEIKREKLRSGECVCVTILIDTIDEIEHKHLFELPWTFVQNVFQFF